MEGLIIKGIAGFYYVKTEKGVFQCKARGIFKNQGVVPCVGDYVTMEITDEEDDEGVINDIHKRKNIFVRPPISNIDLLIVVVAAEDPKPNTEIIDKFLVTAEQAQVEAVVCINKEDLTENKGGPEDNIVEELTAIYEPIYKTIVTSAKLGTGLDKLKDLMRGKKSALIGPSGVGKSTVINALQGHLNLETGDISKKTKRGKHTTRHVEIFETDFGGMIYDTPGFTSFEVQKSEDVGLEFLFPEFEPYINKCKFDNCKHRGEPKCAIRDAVSAGDISRSRYDSYIKIGDKENG